MSALRSLKFLSVSALVLGLAAPAHAEVEAQKVVDAVIAQFAGQGMTLVVASSELDGENVVAKGVSLAPAGVAEPFAVGDVVLEGVTEDGAGYVVGKISAPAISKDEAGTKIDFAGASLNNVHIAGAGETDPVKQMFLYDTAEIGAVTVTAAGAEVFSMEGGKASMSPYVAGEPMTFEMSLDGLHGDLTKIPDPKSQEAMSAMGYTEVNGTITAKGTWNPADGHLAITEGSYDFKDVGKLNILADISGYTPSFVKAIQDMNKNSAGQDESAKGLAMLGLIQQLSFNSMSIRFDDASLTNRIIDYAAKQAGQPRDQIINQSKAIIPFAVAQLNDSDFAAQVTAAASAYMDAPKSLEITAKPAAPLSFAQLIATGSANPADLIKQMGVTVNANQ